MLPKKKNNPEHEEADDADAEDAVEVGPVHHLDLGLQKQVGKVSQPLSVDLYMVHILCSRSQGKREGMKYIVIITCSYRYKRIRDTERWKQQILHAVGGTEGTEIEGDTKIHGNK